MHCDLNIEAGPEVELAVTEHALALLLDAIRDHGPVESSGTLHKCSVCGQQSAWSAEWVWFGSYREMEEDWANVRKSCSRPCWEQMTRKIASANEERNKRRRPSKGRAVRDGAA